MSFVQPQINRDEKYFQMQNFTLLVQDSALQSETKLHTGHWAFVAATLNISPIKFWSSLR